MNKEIQRLQELAGINEIKINNPLPIQDGEECIILTDVYYFGDDEDDYDDIELYDLYGGQAVPEYELKENRENINDILESEEYAVYLYIKKGEKGIYTDGMFESDDGSDTRIEPKYLKRI
jgi:hypothetical protein